MPPSMRTKRTTPPRLWLRPPPRNLLNPSLSNKSRKKDPRPPDLPGERMLITLPSITLSVVKELTLLEAVAVEEVTPEAEPEVPSEVPEVAAEAEEAAVEREEKVTTKKKEEKVVIAQEPLAAREAEASVAVVAAVADLPEEWKVRPPKMAMRALLKTSTRKITSEIKLIVDSLERREKIIIPSTERVVPAEAVFLPRVAMARATGEPLKMRLRLFSKLLRSNKSLQRRSPLKREPPLRRLPLRRSPLRK